MPSAQAIRDAARRLCPAYHIQGDLIRDGAMLHGWCWSPARPQERLNVILFQDDAEIGTAVAARLRLDLVREGVCDGYHGFSFPLLQAEFSRLEAREAVTGRPFGRVLGHKMADVENWAARAVSLELALAAAHTISVESPKGRSRGETLASRLRGLCLPGLCLPGLCLPVGAAPKVSLVMDAGPSRDQALEAVIRLAPVLRSHAAQLLIVEGGQHAESAALASLPGLVYCLSHARDGATRTNLACRRAAGERIMIIDPACVSLASADMLLEAVAEPNDIIVGATIAHIAGVTDWPFHLPDGTGPSGLLLSVSRAAFDALGGLDPAMDDAGYLPMLDFALRAQRLGYRVVCLGEHSHRADAPAAAGGARRLFAQRLREDQNV